jgi:hypothetical protein
MTYTAIKFCFQSSCELRCVYLEDRLDSSRSNDVCAQRDKMPNKSSGNFLLFHSTRAVCYRLRCKSILRNKEDTDTMFLVYSTTYHAYIRDVRTLSTTKWPYGVFAISTSLDVSSVSIFSLCFSVPYCRILSTILDASCLRVTCRT